MHNSNGIVFMFTDNTNNPRPPIEDPLRIPPRPAPGIVPENPNLWLANNNC